MGGPWVVLGQVLGIDRWTSSFSPNSVDGFTTPVWVRMPGLPLYCWSSTNIARISTRIGEPLWLDSATDQMDRGMFARACIRIDLSKPLKSGIWVDGLHGRFFQPVEYEGLSLFCFRCSQVGHKVHSCKRPAPMGEGASDPHVSIATAAGPPRGAMVSDGCAETPLATSSPPQVDDGNSEDRGAGPWMLVTRRKSSSNGKGARPQRNQVGHAAGSRNTTFSGSSMDPSSSPRHSGATSSHVAKARPARDLLSRERTSIQINGSSASPKDEGILHKGVAQVALKGDSNTLDRDQPKMNFHVHDHANVTVQQEVIDVPVFGGFSAMPSGNRNSAAGSLVAGQRGGRGSRPSRPPIHRPSQPLGVPPSGDVQLAVEHEQVDVRLEHEDMRLVEPQTVCSDALIAFVGKSSSSLQGLDVAAPPLGVMVPYINVDACHRTTLEGGKRKGLKVEKMLNDLGPTSPTPRKRRMIAVTPDGGDASPSPPA